MKRRAAVLSYKVTLLKFFEAGVHILTYGSFPIREKEKFSIAMEDDKLEVFVKLKQNKNQ